MSSENKNRLFFNKYLITKLLCETLNSEIYKGININNNENVAMKFEKRASGFNLLESEAYFLITLKGFGIPKIITYGKSGKYNILIEELLGPSIKFLWELKRNRSEKELLKDICMLSIQGIDRLEYIHSKNIIHRDIKHDNFLIGIKDPNIIYVIDFGLSRKYRSSRTGKHIKFRDVKRISGSLRYMSRNSNRGYELSRRDDLESFGYMIIYLATRYLPWLFLEHLGLDKNTLIQTFYKLKNSVTPEELCKDLPKEFSEFLKYVRNLDFEQTPDYNYIRGLFISVLSRNEQKNDLLFSWIINQNNNPENNDEKINYMKKRRDSSQKRLYNKIKCSLEKRNKSLKNTRTNLSLEKENNLKFIILNKKENISYSKKINKQDNVKNEKLKNIDEKTENNINVYNNKIFSRIGNVSPCLYVNNITYKINKFGNLNNLNFYNKKIINVDNKNTKSEKCTKMPKSLYNRIEKKTFEDKINKNSIINFNKLNNYIKLSTNISYKTFHEREKLQKRQIHRLNTENDLKVSMIRINKNIKTMIPNIKATNKNNTRY